MAVTKRARYEVFRRDGHRCTYCGTSAEDGANLTIDHVTPVSLGGTDDPANLVTACRDCNAGKSSVPVDAPLVAAAAGAERKWKGAIAQAAQDAPVSLATPLPAPRRGPRKTLPRRVIGEEDDRERRIQDDFSAEWRRWKTSDGRTLPLPASWRGNIVGLVRSGLPLDEMLKFVEVAMNARTKGGDDSKWRYFCGCCWRRIEQLQDRAEETLLGAHACTCGDNYGRHQERPPHGSQAECDAYAEGALEGRRPAADPTGDCGHCVTCADRRNGDVDVEECSRVDTCPHCSDPTCNYQAGREAGVQDGMDYAGRMEREQAERRYLAVSEADGFLRVVTDLMPAKVGATVMTLSLPTAGEASLRELAQRYEAGDLAGVIDPWAWSGVSF